MSFNYFLEKISLKYLSELSDMCHQQFFMVGTSSKVHFSWIIWYQMEEIALGRAETACNNKNQPRYYSEQWILSKTLWKSFILSFEWMHHLFLEAKYEEFCLSYGGIRHDVWNLGVHNFSWTNFRCLKNSPRRTACLSKYLNFNF